jgi:DNA replication protein DnaC
MSNRRFEMHEYRQIIARMRLGDTDRAIARTGLMGRKKAARIREIALAHGWLNTARLRKAKFRNHKTLEDFDFAFNRSINRALILDLATGRFIEEKVSVLIAGPCGTGKSHIAQALGHCAIRQGYEVLFTTQSKLLGQLQAAHATHTFERRFQALVKSDLLIIDDFGLKPIRPPQDEDFHDLIAERYERRDLIITNNLDFPEWGEVFPIRILGVATLDRLLHGAYRAVRDGNSSRAPKPLPEKPKNTLAKGGEKA